LEETDSAICYLSKAKINTDIYAKAISHNMAVCHMESLIDCAMAKDV